MVHYPHASCIRVPLVGVAFLADEIAKAVVTTQLRTRTFWRSGAATATSAKLQKESAPPATCNKARARSALTHASLTLPSCV